VPYFARMSFSAIYHPLFVCKPDVGPVLEEMRRQFDAEHRASGIFSSGTMNDDLELPPEAFCTEARETKGFKKFPDVYVSLKYWPGVVQEFKDLVEEFEPGVHQFSAPVQLYYKDGTPCEKIYYCINMRRYLDHTIIMEQSSGPTISYKGKTNMDPTQHDDTLTLNEAVIAGRHFWRARDFRNEWFCSDEFKRAIERAKLKKLDFTRCQVGRR
jgi:hypothetical protein